MKRKNIKMILCIAAIASALMVSFIIPVNAADDQPTELSVNGYILTAKVSDEIDKILTIDFKEEEIISPVKIEGYSLNGTTWIKLAITENKAANISALLNKGGANVKFTNKFEISQKPNENLKPAENAAVWTIGKIDPRPKAPKIKVFYTSTKWTVTGMDDPNVLWYAESINGNVPSVKSYIAGSAAGAEYFNIKPLTGGKEAKYNYYVKYGPVLDEGILIPASKPAKIKVSGMLKAPNIKVDYKRDLVVLKDGITYKYGEMQKPIASTGKNTVIYFRNENGGIFDNLDDYSDGYATLTYYLTETGKKPQSVKAEVKIWDYIDWTSEDTAAIEKGYNGIKHMFKLPKGYEVWDQGKDKWVKSIKITSTVEFKVRKTGTAKFDAKNSDGRWVKSGTKTASLPMSVTIIWSEYDTGKKDKFGIPIIKPGIANQSDIFVTEIFDEIFY